jgi:myo-inositol 2-dehydrogenase/D-chiro-inositol 1-dehydrogenase
MLKFGLIGAGRIAALHARHIAEREDLSLAIVVDVNLEAASRLAAPYGAAASADVAAALGAPEIDAVLVASSSNTHAELVTRAVAAGKPVFCEKPLDLDLERANACLRAIADQATGRRDRRGGCSSRMGAPMSKARCWRATRRSC